MQRYVYLSIAALVCTVSAYDPYQYTGITRQSAPSQLLGCIIYESQRQSFPSQTSQQRTYGTELLHSSAGMLYLSAWGKTLREIKRCGYMCNQLKRIRRPSSADIDACTCVSYPELLAHNIMELMRYDEHQKASHIYVKKLPTYKASSHRKGNTPPQSLRDTYIRTILENYMIDYRHFAYDQYGWHPLGYAIYTASAEGVSYIMKHMLHIPYAHKRIDLIPKNPLAYTIYCALSQLGQDSLKHSEYFRIIDELCYHGCIIDTDVRNTIASYEHHVWNLLTEITPDQDILYNNEYLYNDIEERARQLIFPKKADLQDIPSLLQRIQPHVHPQEHQRRWQQAYDSLQIIRCIKLIQQKCHIET